MVMKDIVIIHAMNIMELLMVFVKSADKIQHVRSVKLILIPALNAI